MASVNKLKNGWQYRVSYKDGDKYKTKSKGGFRTKKEAEIAAAEIEKKFHIGQDIHAGDQLFSVYMRNWFEIYKKGKFTKDHERHIERTVELVEENFPGVKIKDLSRDMYQMFINEYSSNHATATIRKRHVDIRSCIRDALEDGVIVKDPTSKVMIKGKIEKKLDELKYLNFDMVKKLVEEVKKDMRPKHISRYIILFAIATGARFSEIMGMTWDCVDFENRSITINKTWDFKDTHNFSDTKTYASKRTITIDNETCRMLKDLKLRQTELLLQSGMRNTNNLCFMDSKMELVSNNAVNKTLKKLCKRIGAKEITCHGLRHTHASVLLYQGVNVKYVSRRLGHTDIVITLQTYSHILDEMEQKESRQVDITMNQLFNAK
jgi:integrase